ncbi:MAG: hypothetical protein ABIL09_27480 [Gemmatimonadota bacterium]
MLHLFDGDLVAILLSAEVIFAVIFTVSLLIAVHSIISFFQRSGSLYTRLAEIEAEMSVLQASIPGKLENIRARRAALQPLQEQFKQIRAYHARLLHLQRRWEEEQRHKEEEEEAEREHQIQRRKLGLDAFI